MSGIRLSAAQKKVVGKWELNDYNIDSIKKEGIDRGDVTVTFKKAQRIIQPLAKEFTDNAIGETYHWHECQVRISKLGSEHKSKLFEHESIIYPHCPYPDLEASASYRAVIDSNASQSSQLPSKDLNNEVLSSTMASKATVQPRLMDDKKNSKRLQLNLRLDGYSQLLDTVKAKASEQGKTITQFVVDALKMACDIEPDPMPSQSSSLPSNLVTREEFEEQVKPLYTKLGSLNWEIHILKDEIQSLRVKDSTVVLSNDEVESLPILEAISLNGLSDHQSDSPGADKLPAPESDRQSDSSGADKLPAPESDRQSDSSGADKLPAAPESDQELTEKWKPPISPKHEEAGRLLSFLEEKGEISEKYARILYKSPPRLYEYLKKNGYQYCNSYRTWEEQSQNLPVPESERVVELPRDEILNGTEVMRVLGIRRADALSRMSNEALNSKGFERIKIGKKSKYKRLLSSQDTRQLTNV